MASAGSTAHFDIDTSNNYQRRTLRSLKCELHSRARKVSIRKRHKDYIRTRPAQRDPKAQCIRKLQRLDLKGPRLSGPFRFLDLPPELRNLVYEEPSVIRTELEGCFPAILATNKQVREEADGILYGKNTGIVKIREAWRSKATWIEVICARGSFSYVFNPVHGASLGTTPYNWSILLHEFSKIRITVQVPPERAGFLSAAEEEDPTVIVNNALYSLVSYLACSKRLSSADFQCWINRYSELTDDDVFKIVWPIIQLPHLHTIGVEGHAPGATHLLGLLPEIATKILEAYVEIPVEVDVGESDWGHN